MNSPLKICLIGFGKMGQTIKRISESRNDVVISCIIDKADNEHGEAFETRAFKESDVVIDFSHPSVVLNSIKACLIQQKPIVVGTTGWLEHRRFIEEIIQKKGGKVLYGSNFSLGVQLFNSLIKQAALLFGKSSLFDASLHEVHHTQKADAPSGTALTLAKTFVQNSATKTNIATEIPHQQKVDSHMFYITAQRLGSVFGEHELRIFSPWDDIRISHTALNRDGFAEGAVKAAIWLASQRKDGFYFIEDVAEEVILR
jgi:4-hydroxy-tetrahydrodipicolinate reductase